MTANSGEVVAEVVVPKEVRAVNGYAKVVAAVK
jgi:hypothetical protein